MTGERRPAGEEMDPQVLGYISCRRSLRYSVARETPSSCAARRRLPPAASMARSICSFSPSSSENTGWRERASRTSEGLR